MGNIVRGRQVSGLPRTLEGARYYTQWAGAPRNVVSKVMDLTIIMTI